MGQCFWLIFASLPKKKRASGIDTQAFFWKKEKKAQSLHMMREFF
jgi:hypothetical protein